MLLYINTTSNTDIYLALKKGKTLVSELTEPAERQQAEKLLPGIQEILKKNSLTLADLTGIEVNNEGGSFTSLRIGVVTANALAFALGIPVRGTAVNSQKRSGGISIATPQYNAEPQITIKKPRLT